jgi:hypothetical protein
MKTRSAASAAFACLALVSSPLAAAKAEEAFAPLGRAETVHRCIATGAGMACGRFEGYVVVGHGRLDTDAPEAFGPASKSAGAAHSPYSALGDERLYLRTGAGD